MLETLAHCTAVYLIVVGAGAQARHLNKLFSKHDLQLLLLACGVGDVAEGYPSQEFRFIQLVRAAGHCFERWRQRVGS